LDELNGVDDEQENEQPLTLYKDEDGEEENEQSLPIHDEAQEVSTLQSTEQAPGPQVMSESASSDDLLPCANPKCARLMSNSALVVGNQRTGSVQPEILPIMRRGMGLIIGALLVICKKVIVRVQLHRCQVQNHRKLLTMSV
jgi:hypothetical protein